MTKFGTSNLFFIIIAKILFGICLKILNIIEFILKFSIK